MMSSYIILIKKEEGGGGEYIVKNGYQIALKLKFVNIPASSIDSSQG